MKHEAFRGSWGDESMAMAFTEIPARANFWFAAAQGRHRLFPSAAVRRKAKQVQDGSGWAKCDKRCKERGRLR